METILNAILTVVRNMATLIVDGVTTVVGWFVDLAILLTAWLPRHTPIEWPDPASVGVFWRGLAIVNRFVNLPALFIVVGLILVIELGIMLYTAYRALLGLVPFFK